MLKYTYIHIHKTIYVHIYTKRYKYIYFCIYVYIYIYNMCYTYISLTKNSYICFRIGRDGEKGIVSLDLFPALLCAIYTSPESLLNL